MRPNRNLLIRRAFAVAVLIVATVGLTSCDGEADYYVVLFGPPADPPGSGCIAYCVGPKTFVPPDCIFQVHRGDKVGIFNFSKGKAVVTLQYRHSDGTVHEEEPIRIKKGKSKVTTIIADVPNDTTIRINYKIDNGPTHGGPNMIIEP